MQGEREKGRFILAKFHEQTKPPFRDAMGRIPGSIKAHIHTHAKANAEQAARLQYAATFHLDGNAGHRKTTARTNSNDTAREMHSGGNTRRH